VQCRLNQPLLRKAYLGAFSPDPVYAEIPWTEVLAEWANR